MQEEEEQRRQSERDLLAHRESLEDQGEVGGGGGLVTGEGERRLVELAEIDTVLVARSEDVGRSGPRRGRNGDRVEESRVGRSATELEQPLTHISARNGNW